MVTELAKPQNNYQSAFQSMRKAKPSVAWVELVRESAMDRFEVLGYPTVKDEEWKYTNLASAAKENFLPLAVRADLTVEDANRFSYPETAASHVVLVNGEFRPELSQTNDLGDVVVLDLFNATTDARYSKIVRDDLARSATYHDQGLTALNTAFLQSGLFVLIPKNVALKTPLQITYITDTGASSQMTLPRVLVVAEENSSAKLIESFVARGEQSYFTNSVVEVVLKDGARLQHVRLQREGRNAIHVGTTSAELGKGSSYNSTAINLGAKLARHDVSVVMDHEGSECWVDGLYVVGPDQHSDTHSLIDHKVPYCNSHQLYKGILDGNGRAVFNGKVFVREGAQKTDALQTNKNLLLSPQARVDTKPQLEIYADDVKCAHGAVGQLDQDELFYLQARGINPDLGKSLLTYGFAEEVIGKIEIESIRKELDEAVMNQLHARLEVQG
ncbi:MAG: Fe-S cluster assembly protein SufD [Acidobacteria bacterium]|nr:MAG: Fe-S cluster assembly protein SufD [Acidobacteriota bacterium]